MEGFGNRREVVRRMVIVGDDALRASGALGSEVQAQGRHSRGMDPRQGGDAPEPGLPSMQAQRTQGFEEEARSLRVRFGCASRQG